MISTNYFIQNIVFKRKLVANWQVISNETLFQNDKNYKKWKI